MFEFLLVVVALLSLCAALVMPFFVSWDWSIWLLLLSILSYLWAGLRRPETKDKLKQLFELLSIFFSDEKIKQLAGVAPAKKKAVRASEGSEWLTPKARAFFMAFWLVPVRIFWWFVGLPRQILPWFCRQYFSVINWRPKFKLPKFQRSKKISGTVSAVVRSQRSEPVVALKSEPVVELQQPTVSEFKVRTVLRMLLRQLGILPEASATTDSLLDSAVTAIEQVLPSQKAKADTVDGSTAQIVEHQETIQRLEAEALTAEQARVTETQLATDQARSVMQAKQAEVDGLVDVRRQLAGECCRLREQLLLLQDELHANDEQNTNLLEQGQDAQEQFVLQGQELSAARLQLKALEEWRVRARKLQEAKDKAEAKQKVLQLQLDKLGEFSSPLIAFGFPATIVCASIRHHSTLFCLEVPEVLGEEDAERWAAWIDWLKAKGPAAQADLSSLFPEDFA